MCLTFKKNNKQTKKPINRFLHDDASAGIRFLQTSIEIKLCQDRWNGLQSGHGMSGEPGSRMTVRLYMPSLHLAMSKTEKCYPVAP